MTVREFLKETYKPHKYSDVLIEIRPHIVCEDGFIVSVQAGEALYCTPRLNLKNGNYENVELGFPSVNDDLIKDYYDGFGVYPYVPVEVVENLIEKHGGIKELIYRDLTI